MTYDKICKSYRENQDKLEKGHEFKWVNGEKKYTCDLMDKVLLKDTQKKRIRESKPVELFEQFFSVDMTDYMIDASKENGLNLNMDDLNTFIGIILVSSFNKRKSQRDYWAADPFLSCEVISSAMSRNTFENIKSKLKFSKTKDENTDDKGWRVRVLLNKFRKNILQYGIRRTAMSVDEMMAKSYARTSLKQFIRGKPVRFGLKFWGLCTADGFLLNVDLYCGKNSIIGEKLAKCALGSRVVLNLLKPFFEMVPAGQVPQFHLYFDNYFTNLDLMVHLNKLQIKCTGTIRENRVADKNVISKTSKRGTYVVKHDKNSGINYITAMDSKLVSIISTAAGVTLLSDSKRYSSESKAKIDIPFPQAFHLYNRFMGGVDLHDGHCNNVAPCIRSKKWTWVVFIRLLQAAIVNALVIFNACGDGQNKVGTKEFVMSIAKSYVQKSQMRRNIHKISRQSKQKKCKNCSIRTYNFCEGCDAYLCSPCMKKDH
ncbi:piggyBac transposable element-derived protein 3-like [Odontomachus brunneus]|uniref:piggyBac transposable element-derived protein 3-like n=1 Tax=Odontomachus brunneus TaxID=486640 RepID=UPI0013F1C9F3|nr:piggyBac transposable element-derived protein 3-like [Odontomachus brunneus]